MADGKGVGDQTPNDDSPVISGRMQSVEGTSVLPLHLMGNAVSHEQGRLIIDFVSDQTSIIVSVDDSIILGRGGEANTDEVAFDLSLYGASEKGVSRRHARLHRTTSIIYITDLKSRNGTLLNGERLLPHQARILRDGDEVYLGKLLFRVHIQ